MNLIFKIFILSVILILVEIKAANNMIVAYLIHPSINVSINAPAKILLANVKFFVQLGKRDGKT